MSSFKTAPGKFRFATALNALDERRAIIVIVLAGLTVLLLGVYETDRRMNSWNMRDLSRRAALVATAIDQERDDDELARTFEKLAADERLIGILLCGRTRQLSNTALEGRLNCADPLVRRAAAESDSGITGRLGAVDVHVSAQRVESGELLIIVHDRSYLWARRLRLLKTFAMSGGVMLVAFAAFVWLFARATQFRVWRRVGDLFGRVIKGEHGAANELPPELSGVADELSARASRARIDTGHRADLGPERLRRLVAEQMPSTNLVLLANREPYIHVRDEGGIRVDRPASGLVTGVEPLLRACGGVWIAHGSGSADRETADANGRLSVPPEAPEYVLRRIWLSTEEEDGYYYGFANEGLWPLCHIAHARPVFRASDWEFYQQVNQRFAVAAAEEAGDRGLILVQDYHFARVPAELRKLAPDAIISLFWHIPWPNHEVVGICPWKQQLLEGMLGADVIGFHTRYHSLNFLETAGRYLESRVDIETMTIEYQGRRTRVREYPISVEWPYPAPAENDARELRESLGIPGDVHVAVGVDRTDYTKGLLERVAAVETLLETHPELLGKFVFVQVGAPSRTHIKLYRDLLTNLQEAVDRVNQKYPNVRPAPIQLILKSYPPEQVRRFYAMGDSALVTPLHDGMNLVAKEYVASCTDGLGVLVLSQFAGAVKELEGALVVNPYDATDVARAIYRAVTMPEQEQRERIRRMRASIEQNTIYDWSAKLLTDMAEMWERRNTVWRDQ